MELTRQWSGGKSFPSAQGRAEHAHWGRRASGYREGEREWQESGSLLVSVFVEKGQSGKRSLPKGNRQLSAVIEKKGRGGNFTEKIDGHKH